MRVFHRFSNAASLLLALSGGCGTRFGYDELTTCLGPRCDPGVGMDPATGADGGSVPPGVSEDGGIPGARGDGGELDDAGEGEDGGRVGGGPPWDDDPRCGSMRGVHEDFDGGSVRRGWAARWYGGASVSLRNDRLEFDLGRQGGEANYRSAQTWDLRGSELDVEVGAGGSVTGVALREGALERLDAPIVPLLGGIAFVVDTGMLNAVVLDVEREDVRASVTYDAEQHRYLRMREAEGVLHWEASPDRTRWQQIHRELVAVDASALRVELFARGRGAGQLAWFDNLNEPSWDEPEACTPDWLADDFDDGRIGRAFRRWYGAGTCSVEETSGRVELTLSESALALCGLVSSSLVRFRDTSFSFELVTLPENDGAAAFADLSSFVNGPPYVTERIELRVNAGTTYMRLTHKPTAEDREQVSFEATMPYDATAQRHFRMREASGRVYWDSSPDGTTWQNQADAALPFATDEMVVGLSAFKSAGLGQTVVRYDDVR